jgi:RNA polymerase sigma-70 factor (ECF subfamily)
VEAPHSRSIVYCVVPRDLVRLHEPLRRHFREQASIEVVVERRASDRRLTADRRGDSATGTAEERRRILGQGGRRVAERRSAVVPGTAPPLPRRARPHAARLQFVERVELSSEQLEDADTARLVTRIQSGDDAIFGDVYLRYFDRVYSYLNVLFPRDPHAAEDVTQQVFLKVLEALPRYVRRTQPFRHWLFVIVRNTAYTELTKRTKVDLLDPTEITRRRDTEVSSDGLQALDWIADRELRMFIDRLPPSQQQILMLRYTLDLNSSEIAEILGMTPAQVRSQKRRAFNFLAERLAAVGRETQRGDRARIRRFRPQQHVLRSRRFALLR